MQPSTLVLIGILLLSLVTVETGGYFMTRVVRGKVPANALQKSMFRAGHAHAGVLLVLSIAILAVLDHAQLSGVWHWLAASGVPVAAIIMPAGFFLSVLGRDPKRPNKLFALVLIGAALLAVALTIGGIGLIRAGLN